MVTRTNIATVLIIIALAAAGLLSTKFGLFESSYIDESSLNTGSALPTITGGFTTNGALRIVIVRGEQTLPKTSFPDQSQVVTGDISDHGGGIEIQFGDDHRNTFLYRVSERLAVGTYTVGVYTYDTIYTEAGYQGDTPPKLLAAGILNVR